MNRVLLVSSAIVIPLVFLIIFLQWAITSPYEEVILEENGVEETYLYHLSKQQLYSINQKDSVPIEISQVTPRTFRIKNGNAEKIYLKDDFEIYHYLTTYYSKVKERKKVAILYIATGRYIKFWEGFYQAMEKYFLPNHDKTYFLFTDHEFQEVEKNVVKVKQEQLPWPYITLKRFHFFDGIKKQLKEFDYIYFLNGTMMPVAEIDEEIFPTKEQGVMVTLHPGNWVRNKFYLPYDRNPKSKSCISDYDGKYYFMGGFNGGTSEAFLKLIETLKRWTDTDLENKQMPRWHDESMLNKYMDEILKKGENPLILLPYYAVPESKKDMLDHEALFPLLKMYILDKKNYGGHNFLRNLKNQEDGAVPFVQNATSSKNAGVVSKSKIPSEGEIMNPLIGIKKVLDF